MNKITMTKYTVILAGIFSMGIMSGMCQQEEPETFFTEPVRLPDVINSSAEEVMPIYTENEMYFVRAFHDANTGGQNTGHDIWVAHQDNRGEWRRANNYFMRLNNKGSNAVVGVSADGKSAYLLNQYAGEADGMDLVACMQCGRLCHIITLMIFIRGLYALLLDN